MQDDKDVLNFSKSLKKNKKLKDSKFSKKKIGWYSEPFIFPKMPEVNKNSDGEPAAEKPKRMPALPISFVRAVQFYKSLSHNYKKTSP